MFETKLQVVNEKSLRGFTFHIYGRMKIYLRSVGYPDQIEFGWMNATVEVTNHLNCVNGTYD